MTGFQMSSVEAAVASVRTRTNTHLMEVDSIEALSQASKRREKIAKLFPGFPEEEIDLFLRVENPLCHYLAEGDDDLETRLLGNSNLMKPDQRLGGLTPLVVVGRMILAPHFPGFSDKQLAVIVQAAYLQRKALDKVDSGEFGVFCDSHGFLEETSSFLANKTPLQHLSEIREKLLISDVPKSELEREGINRTNFGESNGGFIIGGDLYSIRSMDAYSNVPPGAENVHIGKGSLFKEWVVRGLKRKCSGLISIQVTPSIARNHQRRFSEINALCEELGLKLVVGYL